jgi:hypothetical protein
MKLYEREQVRGASCGADKVSYWTKGQKYPDFTTKTYVQSDVFMDSAFNASLAAGSINPISFTWHFEGDGDQFDIMGAVVQEWTLDCPEGVDWPTEEIKWFYYDVIDGFAVTNFLTTVGAMFLASPVPYIKKDISVSFGGTTMNEVTSINAKVKIEYKDQPVAGRLQHFDPYVLSRDFILEVTGYVDNTTSKLLPTALTPTTNKTTIITIGAKTLTVTNTVMDATNLGEVPGKDDFKKWKFSIKMGGDCAFSNT